MLAIFRVLKGIPTKLMCFTRSSPLIRQLPNEFPTHGSSLHQTQEDFLKQYLSDDIDALVLCKLSSRHSQTNLEDILKSFSVSDRKVLIFVVDAGTTFYQQSPTIEQKKLKENISHLRMMIEEAEARYSSGKAKIFVVLIHFPPARLLTKPCYPALFLQGWDHFYLDTIADGALTRSGTTASVINVEKWLYSCLVQSKPSSLEVNEMEPNIKDILRDAIPLIASRLTLRSKESEYMSFLDVSSKTSALKHILLGSPGYKKSYEEQSHDEGESAGDTLARSFSKYWNSREMNQYLQTFTSLTFIRKSTLNLTASVETTFRSLFVDFLVYRLSHMEVTLELYMLLDKKINPCLVKCLLCCLENLPLPKLEQLPQLSELPIVKFCSPPKDYPKFPFLNDILKKIDLIIEESDEEVKRDFYKELAPGREIPIDCGNQLTPKAKIDKYCSVVENKVEQHVQDKVHYFFN